jgi:hypothetical protein
LRFYRFLPIVAAGYPRLWRLADHGVTRVFAKSKVNLDELLMWVEEQAGKAPPPPGDAPAAPHDAI